MRPLLFLIPSHRMPMDIQTPVLHPCTLQQFKTSQSSLVQQMTRLFFLTMYILLHFVCLYSFFLCIYSALGSGDGMHFISYVLFNIIIIYYIHFILECTPLPRIKTPFRWRLPTETRPTFASEAIYSCRVLSNSCMLLQAPQHGYVINSVG